MSFEVSDVEDWLVKYSETVERCLSCKAGSYDLFNGLRQTDCQIYNSPYLTPQADFLTGISNLKYRLLVAEDFLIHISLTPKTLKCT